MAVFENFFGTINPFADFNPSTAEKESNGLPSAYGHALQHLDGQVSSLIPGRGPTTSEAKRIKLDLTLEELYMGGQRSITFKRDVYISNRNMIKKKDSTSNYIQAMPLLFYFYFPLGAAK